VLVRALDLAGNYSSAAQVTLVVDNEKPIIEMPAPRHIIPNGGSELLQAVLVAAITEEKELVERNVAQLQDEIIQDTSVSPEAEESEGDEMQDGADSLKESDMEMDQSADENIQSQNTGRMRMWSLGLFLILGLLLLFVIVAIKRKMED
jgi:hypothetical protein